MPLTLAQPQTSMTVHERIMQFLPPAYSPSLFTPYQLHVAHIDLCRSNHAGALDELDVFTDGTVLAQLEPLLDAQQASDVPPLFLLYHAYLELMPGLAGPSPKPELRLLNAIAFGSNTILPKVGLWCCTLESNCFGQLGSPLAEGTLRL